MSRRDERGSFAPMTALLMTVVVGFTAFAVDLGLQRAAARDMQAIADTVALDTARALPSCDDAALTTVANRSLARQTSEPIGQTEPLTAVAGRVDPATGAFVVGAGGTGGCDAVRVSATTTVGYAFAPVIGTDSGTATRTAVGTRTDGALCLSAGTRALTLSPNKKALGPLLDRVLGVNLGVAGYDGLVTLQGLRVPIADLAGELGVATPTELMDADVSLGQLMVATAGLLRADGHAAQATVLESLATQVDDLAVRVGSFLAVGTTGDSGLDAQIDTLDLIGSATVGAAIANGRNAVALDASLGLPRDLLNADSRLVLVEAPQIACGPVGTTARTAQVRLDVRSELNALGLVGSEVSLGVRVAPGTAELTAIDCGNPQRATVHGRTSLASIVGYGGSGPATLRTTVLLLPITLALNGGVNQHEASHYFNFPPAPDFVRTYGGGQSLVITADTSGLLGSVLNPVLNIVNRLTGPVNSLVRPLFNLLGIDLGKMEVSVLGEPTCDGVRLAG